MKKANSTKTVITENYILCFIHHYEANTKPLSLEAAVYRFLLAKDLLGKLAGEAIQVVQVENFSIHFVTKLDKIVLHADMASIQSIE